ncbi:RNA polymerase sigma factor [Phenylobacterium sp.]|jgi:RNA polymerase sigma-70 factor (ECF subfamily)|uniref:RNA polymerase sigma factor n=1 Tax=Phenylobacterium sp. TaxID=1871053 RepID=UPI002E342CF5|nr:sigma-70 family RNA polymerase sigma factor [Phenylobacterium sp.]HEX3366551.1 sigma-70 family RNA polymerase sigma factor [Phenylobacterium sp.]
MALASSGPSERRAAAGPLLAAFLEKRGSLVLFVAARMRSMAAAEDLVQDLYLKIAAMPADAAVQSPTALLYRMAANLVVDHVRSDQRASRRNAQWRVDTRVTLGSLDLVSEPAADEQLMEKDRARLLAEAVADLPPQMGRAFRLHKLEGRSQAQTAEAMGVSQKMVEQHIAVAIRRLAERLRS